MRIISRKEQKDEWVGIIYKEDVLDAVMVLIIIAAMIGLVDGLLEDIMLEAFIWSGVFFFGIVLFLFQLFKDKMMAAGISLFFFGSFLGLMQSVFWVCYAILRNFPQGELGGKLWIVPGVIFTLDQFWLSVAVGYVMMIAGYFMIRR